MNSLLFVSFSGVASIGPGPASPTFNTPGLRSKKNIQNKNNKKNLNPCHQMLFLGSKYTKIAFAAPDPS